MTKAANVRVLSKKRRTKEYWYSRQKSAKQLGARQKSASQKGARQKRTELKNAGWMYKETKLVKKFGKYSFSLKINW